MRVLTLLLLLFSVATVSAQTVAAAEEPAKPAYCEEATTYAKSGSNAPALPEFNTSPTKEYKVQVAILRFTDPAEYPFHPSLVARYRPCEQVWVVESRKSFADRAEAEALQNELNGAGYAGSYITELIAYQ